MIRFLFKGLIKDRQRSKLPLLVIAIGVMFTVTLYCYITGVMIDSTKYSANFETGHVKIVSKAYAEIEYQAPNDLALMDVDPLMNELQDMFPEMTWVKRIRFGGLIDVADENGETRTQGPASGIAVDLFSENTQEIERFNIESNIIQGKLPVSPGEVLISEQFAQKLKVSPGDELTLFSSTMYGSMAFYNFTVAGTVRFGAAVLDRGTILADITDVQLALDMENASSEILGYFTKGYYDDTEAAEIEEKFNDKYMNEKDEFAPVMSRMKMQGSMAEMMKMAESMSGIISFGFILIMSIVLWNAGLIGGLRRYGEFGLRLAIGENKGHVYRTMIYEAILIGFMGSVLGTIIGLGFAYLLQEIGINVEAMMKDTSMMFPSHYRARITPEAFYIGFIPGLLAAILGAMLSGIGIYKRKTASLFKELEN